MATLTFLLLAFAGFNLLLVLGWAGRYQELGMPASFLDRKIRWALARAGVAIAVAVWILSTHPEVH